LCKSILVASILEFDCVDFVDAGVVAAVMVDADGKVRNAAVFVFAMFDDCPFDTTGMIRLFVVILPPPPPPSPSDSAL